MDNVETKKEQNQVVSLTTSCPVTSSIFDVFVRNLIGDILTVQISSNDTILSLLKRIENQVLLCWFLFSS